MLPGGSDGKESVYNAGDLGSIPNWEDPLEKEMATHSNILAWKIPWIEEPGRLWASQQIYLPFNLASGGFSTAPPLISNYCNPPLGLKESHGSWSLAYKKWGTETHLHIQDLHKASHGFISSTYRKQCIKSCSVAQSCPTLWDSLMYNKTKLFHILFK